jgi:hypothetical protein
MSKSNVELKEVMAVLKNCRDCLLQKPVSFTAHQMIGQISTILMKYENKKE